MRSFEHCHTQPKQGNIVEALDSKNWVCHVITKEDEKFCNEDRHVFVKKFRPMWVNETNLKLLKFELILYKELNETCYYEEYVRQEKRKTYVLQIYYEEIYFRRRQEEKISYKLFTGYDHLCNIHTQDLYLHDIQNLIEKYEND